MNPKAQRHRFILETLRAVGRVDVIDLSAQLGVAEMTIRRDLDFLSAEGALRRVRGGGVVIGSSFEPPFVVRQQVSAAEKKRIARLVATMIPDGSTVLLDGGTTGLAVAEELMSHAITVVPLSLRIATLLAGSATIDLYIPGGLVRTGDQSLTGPETIGYLRGHRFDTYVLTASGVTVNGGFSEWSPEEASIKQFGLASCSRSIAAVDSTKFGQTAFTHICNVADVDVIATDSGLDVDERRLLDSAPVRVVIAH